MRYRKITKLVGVTVALLSATVALAQEKFDGVQYLEPASRMMATPPATPQNESRELAFDDAKMFVTEDYKMKLRKVKLSFTTDQVLVTGDEGKFRDRVEFPYPSLKEAGYEYSSERRWGAAVLVSPLFLLSKGKKHWLTLVRNLPDGKTEETVFQLDKKNYAQILAAFERTSGKKVTMVSSKQ